MTERQGRGQAVWRIVEFSRRVSLTARSCGLPFPTVRLRLPRGKVLPRETERQEFEWAERPRAPGAKRLAHSLKFSPNLLRS